MRIVSSIVSGAVLSVAAVVGLTTLPSIAANVTQVVSPGNTQGWVFNPDPTTATPYEFTTSEASIGNGSLYVPPIDNIPDRKDKFIANKELKVAVADLQSIAYDFLIAGNGTVASANHFYLNVYVNTVNDDKFFDCSYDYSISTGSTTDFTTASFTPSSVPSNVRKSGTARVGACPATLDQFSTGFVRAIVINVGDTASDLGDTGLAGYLDKAVVTTTSNQTTYDFEPYQIATEKDQCKNEGWKYLLNTNLDSFKNQGLCVASVESSAQSKHNRQ